MQLWIAAQHRRLKSLQLFECNGLQWTTQAPHRNRLGRDSNLAFGAAYVIVAVNQGIHDCFAYHLEWKRVDLPALHAVSADNVGKFVPQPLLQLPWNEYLWTIEVPKLFSTIGIVNRRKQPGLGNVDPRLYTEQQYPEPRRLGCLTIQSQ